ncbi:MAG: flagellar FliJ family protein [Agromyces sp.]
MNRAFSLSGLLRVRRIQEDQAQGVLAARNGRLRDNEAVRERALRHLEAFGEPGTSLETLRAVAAARAASAAMLGEWEIRQESLERSAAEARVEHAAAHARTRGIERLETAHAAHVAEADLKAEQSRLDELTASRTATGKGR